MFWSSFSSTFLFFFNYDTNLPYIVSSTPRHGRKVNSPALMATYIGKPRFNYMYMHVKNGSNIIPCVLTIIIKVHNFYSFHIVITWVSRVDWRESVQFTGINIFIYLVHVMYIHHFASVTVCRLNF